MGVRNRKTRKTKVVKIIGRTVRTGHECHKARGVHENTMTGLLETSIPLDKAYAALGIASEGGMSKTKKALAVRGVPEGMQKPTIEAPPAAPKLPEHVSEVEYSFVESLIEKHGLDYNAMARCVLSAMLFFFIFCHPYFIHAGT